MEKKWNKEFITQYNRIYRQKNKDKLRKQNREWKRKNKEKNKELNKQERERLKLEVLIRYSNSNPPKCVKCGYSDVRALSIDHILNNGAEERRNNFGSRLNAGTTFYRWLRRNNFPTGYQTLCFNCNWIKELKCRQ